MPEPVPPPPAPVFPDATVQPVPAPGGRTQYGRMGLSTRVAYGKGSFGPYIYGDKPAHVVDWEERAFRRNSAAGILGLAAGACFLLGGVTGAGWWEQLGVWAAPAAGGFEGVVRQLFLAVAAVAALGGFLVLGGGVSLLAQRLFLGKLLVFVGGGTGLTGLLLSLGLPLWQGAMAEFGRNLSGLWSLSGAGTLLAIAAGLLTTLPFSLRKVLFGKG
jgi:hypothetical protein